MSTNNNHKYIIVLEGLPGSGKTTLANKLQSFGFHEARIAIGSVQSEINSFNPNIYL